MADAGPLDRRAFLKSSAATGGGLALASVLAPSAAAARKPSPITFSADSGINFEYLFSFGGLAYGTGEFGPLLRAANEVDRRGGTPKAAYRFFRALGEQTASYAEEAQSAGFTGDGALSRRGRPAPLREPMAPQFRNETLDDWLAGVFAGDI